MPAWMTAELTHEGFPLLLRRPANLDPDLHRASRPNLAVVTHEFLKVTPNGLPEADYNDGLAELDHDIVTTFDSSRTGIAALVETFGGKRHYYFYVAADTDISETMGAITRRYPNEKLTWSVRSDPTWSFIKGYAQDIF